MQPRCDADRVNTTSSGRDARDDWRLPVDAHEEAAAQSVCLEGVALDVQLVDAGELLDDEVGDGDVVFGEHGLDDMRITGAVGEAGAALHGEEDEALLAVGDAGGDERGQAVDDALRFLLDGEGTVDLAALGQLRVGAVLGSFLEDELSARANAGFGFGEDAVHVEGIESVHLRVTSLISLIFMTPGAVHGQTRNSR